MSIHMGGIGNTVHLSFPSTSFEIFIFTLPGVKLISLVLLGNVYFLGVRGRMEVWGALDR